MSTNLPGGALGRRWGADPQFFLALCLALGAPGVGCLPDGATEDLHGAPDGGSPPDADVALADTGTDSVWNWEVHDDPPVDADPDAHAEVGPDTGSEGGGDTSGDPDAAGPGVDGYPDACPLLACSTGCNGTPSACDCPPGEAFDGLGCRQPTTTCTASDEACVPDEAATAHCVPATLPGFSSIAASRVLVADSEWPLLFQATNAAGHTSRWVGDTFHPGRFVGDVVVTVTPWSPACATVQTHTYAMTVLPSWPGPVGAPDSDAIQNTDPRIVGWATNVLTVTYGDEVDPSWQDPEQALGPAEGNAMQTLPLGEGGSIALSFAPLPHTPDTRQGIIEDGDGPDFVVFENSFDGRFLELAFVEVSSDGEHWARFDTSYDHVDPVDTWGFLDPRNLGGFAGTFVQGWGTPFDLAALHHHPEVLRGLVDLGGVRYLRIVDIAGDGREHDSFGTPIYDPFPHRQTAGFDLDGVGVLNLR